eukprot:NODE_22_length_42145_cov_1.310612.p27 type:complete len:183 gc:universal NODE_22_length_42145_cov_1.310612:25184-25732(+)
MEICETSRFMSDHRKDDILLVILHPHPYLGGTPHNNIATLFRSLPCQIYCPQLRGVIAECEINRILMEISKRNHKHLFICGYSYGSLVATLLAMKLKSDKLLLISIPWSISYLCTFKSKKIKQFINSTDVPISIVHGSEDQFTSSSKIRRVFKNVRIVNMADHFWFGREDELMLNCRDFFLL